MQDQQPKKLAVPTVHLNGSSRESLLTAISYARGALFEALRALDEASPNARDFYVQGDGAFELARRQHEARIAAVRNVNDELSQIEEEIVDA